MLHYRLSDKTEAKTDESSRPGVTGEHADADAEH